MLNSLINHIFVFFLLQLTDEVVRKKAEYQKHLEGYKALRTRFEEHYIKGKLK